MAQPATLPPSEGVWITWESQPRNRSMARELRLPLYEFSHRGTRPKRYLLSLRDTLRILIRHRPRVVFAQNPSVVLALFMLLAQRIFGFRLALDAHYGGVVAVNGSSLLQRLLNHINRSADYVIVTNPGHEQRIREIGGQPLVCPDPLPDLPQAAGSTEPVGKSVLFICSFDPDEPWQEILEAGRRLTQEGFRVSVSGNCRKAGLVPGTLAGVTLLGYVPRSTYLEHLQNADVLVDLTAFEDCLVCGAYEAMAAGRPCVLSGTTALRGYFSTGTVFTGHDPADITDAVHRAHATRSSLQAHIINWRKQNIDFIAQHMQAIASALALPTRRL